MYSRNKINKYSVVKVNTARESVRHCAVQFAWKNVINFNFLLLFFIPTRCPFAVHVLSVYSDILSGAFSKHLEWEAC